MLLGVIMIAIFISMFVFALIGAITPGPVNIIATGSGANYGFKRTFPYVFGASLSYTCIVFLVGIGLNQTLLMFPNITVWLKYIGGAFLLYMSYKIATATPMDPTIKINAQRPPLMLEGALAQALNPKAWLISVSGVSVFVFAHSPASLYLMVFCFISFSVCIVGISTWAAIGYGISAYLSTKRRQIMFNWAMGFLLSCTVMSIWLSE